jgi:hypothetical protein
VQTHRRLHFRVRTAREFLRQANDGGVCRVDPRRWSQQRSLATLTTLVDAVEAAVPAGAQRRARATALAHQLFAFCHGWVSLEQIGLLARQAASDRAFGAALHAIMATPNTAPTAAPIAAPIAAVKQQPQGRQGARRSC